MIAVDIEAFDPNLSDMGDGSIRGDGAILCVGLYDGKDYVNCTPDDPRLKDWLATDEDKIFHNSVYDLSWLICGYNFHINGIIHDTMTRTALIDEYHELNLDACCKKFKVAGKNAEDTIELWWKSASKEFGLRGSLWDHADVVWMVPEGRRNMIRYNQQDCIATYNLWHAQEPYMRDIRAPYEVECRLTPVIMEMKKNGIRLDLTGLERFTNQIDNELSEVEARLYNAYGINRSIIASPKQLGAAMNSLGIQSPVTTATGNQSWAADVLDLLDHPAVPLVQEVKNKTALVNKYLRGSMARNHVNGRIHCTFSPNKRDGGGTITGRFASSKPNMQNIPAREEKHGQKTYGQEMRSLFLPDEGYLLAAPDYSQIEYLILAHYAQGEQAPWFREQANGGVDFHTAAQQMTQIDSRDVVKRMNYGFIYGMGINKLVSTNRLLFRKLANEAGIENIYVYGKQLYDMYHSRLPVIKTTMNWVQQKTKQQGYIASIGGRLHHKPRPVFMDGRWNDGIYKMTNYLIQGSAAEILKAGLLAAWDAGVFDVLRLHLTVHDENVCSVPYNNIGTEALRELLYHMENAYKSELLVPMKVACEVGPTWGYWDDDIWNNMKQGVYNYAA